MIRFAFSSSRSTANLIFIFDHPVSDWMKTDGQSSISDWTIYWQYEDGRSDFENTIIVASESRLIDIRTFAETPLWRGVCLPGQEELVKSILSRWFGESIDSNFGLEEEFFSRRSAP